MRPTQPANKPDAGMNDVLTKPVAFEELESAISHWGCGTRLTCSLRMTVRLSDF